MHKNSAEQTLIKTAWEQPYLKALLDSRLLSGEVLEVGFGCGYSAECIQAHHPKHHTIIESHPESAAQAIKWADGNPKITVIQDTWQKALPKLGTFDAVFFLHFESAEARSSRETAHMAVQKGKKLLATVKEQIPEITTIHYSNADLEEFFHQVGKQSPKEMCHFIDELRKNGQISEEQYQAFAAKHHLEKKAAVPKLIEQSSETLLSFIEACLKKHLRKGSRIYCFSTDPLSKYECPPFFEKIITNPNLDYKELVFAAGAGEALVSILEKLN